MLTISELLTPHIKRASTYLDYLTELSDVSRSRATDIEYIVNSFLFRYFDVLQPYFGTSLTDSSLEDIDEITSQGFSVTAFSISKLLIESLSKASLSVSDFSLDVHPVTLARLILADAIENHKF